VPRALRAAGAVLPQALVCWAAGYFAFVVWAQINYRRVYFV
jgi:hypothetical protein